MSKVDVQYVSAEEARKLLAVYRIPGGEQPLTLNNAQDEAMFRAAPSLAHTVIALTEERDRLRAAETEHVERNSDLWTENTNRESDCMRLTAERDRLGAILAAERGERAPEGWEWTDVGEFRFWRRDDWVVSSEPGSGKWGYANLNGKPEPVGFCTYALEAIEAADRAAEEPA